MQNGRMTNMNRRPQRPAGSPADRSRRWSSNAPRPAPNGAHNAQKNYERYLALAQAEVRLAIGSRPRTTTSMLNIILGRCPRTESDIKFHIRTRARETEFFRANS